jgi:hypothetical protein
VFSAKHAIMVGKWLACLVLTAVSLYVIALGVGFFLLSKAIYFRNVDQDSARNSRGDEVFASTDFNGGETHPSKTVIRLKRRGHPFSTTLLEAHSYDVLVGLQWQNNDNLVVQVDFGCDGAHSAPIAVVGPIHIHYRFGDPGRLPPAGYETAPRPDPAQPCR